MGRKKKHYHYDLDQYRDANNNLLFLLRTLPLHDNGLVYLLTDCYDNEVVYPSLEVLTKITLTYKEAMRCINKFNNYPENKLPKTYHISDRGLAIHLLIENCYNDVSVDTKPTYENIADIFGIALSTLIKCEQRLVISFKNGIKTKPDKPVLAHIFSLSSVA